MSDDLKLRIEYMELEEQYRKLEKRVAELEAEFEVGIRMGTMEKIKNTSVSLFLLRRDRERLASELGLPIVDYEKAKSLIENELEAVLYENQDIINIFESQGNAVAEESANDAVSTSKESSGTAEPEKVIVKQRKGRRRKVEAEDKNAFVGEDKSNESASVEDKAGTSEMPSSTVVVASPNKSVQPVTSAPIFSASTESVNDGASGEDADEGFADLEAAVNMWK